MEFSELLGAEHQPIRRALRVLETMADKAEEGVSPDIHDINAVLIFLHYFADACHQAKEESILFPGIRQSKGYVPSPELDALIEEHGFERSLAEKTQVALFSDKPSEFVTNARELVQVLSDHCVKEERVLFPLAERILSEQEASDVATKLEQADAEFGSTQRRILIELLEALERRYTPMAA